ncbi:hypothetical protein BDD12DRAFT_9458 [Trichophaea hybrida]|nr:hypothetical protein BDD12DRAFT_9458 [Trichophaea hybrida]
MATMINENMLLPSIKCSVCNAEVEISLMGDHVCGSTLKGPVQSRSIQRPFILPQIDPSIANSPFIDINQLTSFSSISAHSPRGGQSLTPPPAREPDSPTIPLSDYYASRPPYSPALSPSPTSGGGGGGGGGKNLLAKMNTIAPGPFGVRRGSNDKTAEVPPSSKSMKFPQRKSSKSYSIEPLQAAAASFGEQGQTGHGGDTQNRESAHGVSPTDRSAGYPQLTPPLLRRSETMPLPPMSEDSSQPPSKSISKPVRRPLYPELGLPRTPSQYRHKVKSTTEVLPPPPPIPSPIEDSTVNRPWSVRKDLNSADQAPQTQQSPTRKELPMKVREIESPLHTATFSESSTTSSAFSHLSNSSRSSPPTSEVSIAPRMSGPKFVDPKTFSHQEYKKPVMSSNGGGLIDNLMNELHILDTRRPSKRDRAPSHEPQHFNSLTQQRRQSQHHQPDSPNSNVPLPLGTGDMSSHSPTKTAQGSRGHKRTLTSKGPCRGCGEQIFGKSISSADGRLTGRYHKQCFSCQTCRQPFQSAEFYVMDNLPYCERHYHELNKSLCAVCDRGIEGPCLETVRRERFHPTCFTCFQCRCVLGDDYFEINGRPFCEYHAHQYMQRPPRPPPNRGAYNGGLRVPAPMPKVEKRRTRLMFMNGADAPIPPGMGHRNQF